MKPQIQYDPKSYWDEKARRAGSNFEAAVCYDNPVSNEIIDRVQRRFMRMAFLQISQQTDLSGKRILDYGCGTGRWLEFFRGYGLEYAGVDLSAEMVRTASERFPDVHFSPLDDGIPFPPLSFDLVCSIAVIHHNPYEEQKKILLQLNRVLKPGGFLVLFESVGALEPDSTLEFPRPSGNWSILLGDLGLKPLWSKQTRYFATRAFMDKLVGEGRLHAVSNRIGVHLDPYLGDVLPSRFQTRGAMVFQKS